MANPYKGEVAVEIEGKTYKLVFSANAQCEVEERLGRPWIDIAMEIDGWLPKRKVADDGSPIDLSMDEVMAAARKVKTSLLRTLIWGALRDYHEEMSIKQAGWLMDNLPPEHNGAIGLITKLFSRAMPEAEPEKENPRKPDSPKDGTGPAS